MWMAVDRIEGNIVVLIDDTCMTHQLSTEDYLRLTGQSPAESHVLSCELADGRVISATYDPQETQRRLDIARARLERLVRRSKK